MIPVGICSCQCTIIPERVFNLGGITDQFVRNKWSTSPVSVVFQNGIFKKKAALAALTAGFMAGYVWNKLYVSELWETVRFPDGHVYEDGCTLIRIIGMAERVVTVPGCPVRHRVRPGSITQTQSAQNILDWMLAREQMEDYVEENTPEFFAPGMLRLVQNQTVQGMVAAWARAVWDRQDYADDLRNDILKKGQSLDLGTWDLRSRVAYQILCFCPQMIPALLPVYQFVRRLYAEITGR